MTNELTKLITFLNEQKRLRAEATDSSKLFPHVVSEADNKFNQAAYANYATIIDIAIKAIEQRNSWAEAWSDRTHESNARDLISDNAELTKICEIGSGK